MSAEKQNVNGACKNKLANSSYELLLDYKNYMKQKKLLTSRKQVFKFKGINVAFTQKQLQILKLVALGFSNARIAKKLQARESAVKLLLYRLIRSLESVLYEEVDRFYLIIIAQNLGLGNYAENENESIKL